MTPSPPSWPDQRQYAPATERNRQPILKVLQQVLPPSGVVLEVASGTGEHAVFLGPRLSPRYWLPSDADPSARASITAWRDHHPCDQIAAPVALDAQDPIWPVETMAQRLALNLPWAPDIPITAIVNINMIHIAPWIACLGLIAGAHRILAPGGILYLYGPFKRSGRHTAPSNAQFDQMLKGQDPEWGVRDLDEVEKVAAKQGLILEKVIQMPANNLSVIFQRV